MYSNKITLKNCLTGQLAINCKHIAGLLAGLNQLANPMVKY